MELRIDHMTKQFQDKRAVNDVSLKLTPGVWGLLGANGAGKTTLMRMVAGIYTMLVQTAAYNGSFSHAACVSSSKSPHMVSRAGKSTYITMQPKLNHVWCAAHTIATLSVTATPIPVKISRAASCCAPE